MYSDLNRARSASALCCATARMGKEQMAPARANAGVDLLIGTSMFALRTTQLKGHAPSSFSLSERVERGACVLCSRRSCLAAQRAMDASAGPPCTATGRPGNSKPSTRPSSSRNGGATRALALGRFRRSEIMRRLVLPTAAGLVLVASAGLASAQQHERGGAGQGGPGGGGGTHAPSGAPSGGGVMHGPGGPGGGSMHGPGGAAPRGELNGPRGYQPERGNRAEPPARRSEPNRRAEPEHKSEPNRRAEPQRTQERTQDRQRATEQRRQGEDRGRAESQREQERNAQRERATQPRSEDQRRAQERDRGGQKERLGEHRQEIAQERIRLSLQDRERLHRSFDFEHARVSNAHFDYHVGHRIPRTVHLFPVSREVIAFFPYYRSYSYFVVGDEICIVDPGTYEVVDVIDEGYWRAPGRQVAGLRLSSGQIALIRDSIPRDFPEANVRLRLALGAEIPDDV